MKGKGCGAVRTIKFELLVMREKGAKGALSFLIVEVGGNYSSKTISKTSFEIGAIKVRSGHDFPFLWVTEGT